MTIMKIIKFKIICINHAFDLPNYFLNLITYNIPTKKHFVNTYK